MAHTKYLSEGASNSDLNAWTGRCFWANRWRSSSWVHRHHVFYSDSPIGIMCSSLTSAVPLCIRCSKGQGKVAPTVLVACQVCELVFTCQEREQGSAGAARNRQR